MLNFFRSISLSFSETSAAPRFEKTSFRFRKKIFATYDYQTKTAGLKLSQKDQNLFPFADSKLIFSVANKWGKHGWIFIKIEELIRDLVHATCQQIAPQKLKFPPTNPSPSHL